MIKARILNKQREIKDKPLMRNILVHRMMNYRCDVCGNIYEFWLEKGLEDKKQDEINPEKHKPVPFCTSCECGGTLQHSFWESDIQLDDYRLLEENENYFENTDNDSCGVSHIRNNGIKNKNNITDNNRVQVMNFLAEQFGINQSEPKEYKKTKEDFEDDPFGLAIYSTTTLKKELRRRKQV